MRSYMVITLFGLALLWMTSVWGSPIGGDDGTSEKTKTMTASEFMDKLSQLPEWKELCNTLELEDRDFENLVRNKLNMALVTPGYPELKEAIEDNISCGDNNWGWKDESAEFHRRTITYMLNKSGSTGGTGAEREFGATLVVIAVVIFCVFAYAFSD